MIYYHVRVFEIILLNKSLYEDFGVTGLNASLLDAGGKNMQTTHNKTLGGKKLTDVENDLEVTQHFFYFFLFTLEK